MEFAAPQKLHRILKNRKLHVSTICTTVGKHRIGQKSRIQPPGISMAFSIWIFICAVNCLKNLSCIYSLCMDVYSASLMLSRSCPLSWLFAKELVHPSLPEPARCNRTTSQTPLRFSPYLTSLWRCDDGWIFSHVPTRNLPKETVNLENRLLKMITCNKRCAILWLQVPLCFLNQNSHVVSLVDAIVLNKIRCAPPKTYNTL